MRNVVLFKRQDFVAACCQLIGSGAPHAANADYNYIPDHGLTSSRERKGLIHEVVEVMLGNKIAVLVKDHLPDSGDKRFVRRHVIFCRQYLEFDGITLLIERIDCAPFVSIIDKCEIKLGALNRVVDLLYLSPVKKAQLDSQILMNLR